MTKEREALKMALEALEEAHYKIEHKQDATKREQAITAIKEALAQPEQEPLMDEQVDLIAHNTDFGDWNSLYCQDAWHLGFREGFREAETEHKIKGNQK